MELAETFYWLCNMFSLSFLFHEIISEQSLRAALNMFDIKGQRMCNKKDVIE